MMDESDLLARAVSGDTPAFEALVKLHQNSVYSFVLRMGNVDADVADDIAQQVFVDAWRSIRRFRGKCALRTWLFSIAMKKIAMHRRTLARAVKWQRQLWSEQASRQHAPTPQEADAEVERVERALRLLSPKLRVVLYLSAFENLSHTEISVICQIPEGTVKSRISNARKRLHELLDPPPIPRCHSHCEVQS